MELKTVNKELKLVGIKDAAKLLSVSTSTLYGWVWQRRIPFVKIGRAVRFAISDLEQFVQANRFAAKHS
jgi:excisionase family DNA binding protein